MKVLLQVLLFSLAPFFVYPWKPILNMIYGDSYAVALKHFKAGHYGGVNLSGHFVCLFVQLFGNFGLLNLIDTKFLPQPFAGVRILSAISALMWAGYLAPVPAPKVVSIASIGSVALAYAFAPQVPKAVFEKTAVSAIVTALVASNFTFAKKKITQPALRWLKTLAYIPAFYLASQALENSSYALSQASNKNVITIGVLAYLAAVAATPNPVKKVVASGMVVTRVASILTGSDELFYLSCGFSASFFQGVTHLITGEEATLIAVGNKGGETALGFEYAHVVYFPTIALHTIYDAVMGSKN